MRFIIGQVLTLKFMAAVFALVFIQEYWRWVLAGLLFVFIVMALEFFRRDSLESKSREKREAERTHKELMELNALQKTLIALIRRSPKLDRYDWSSDRKVLIRQLKDYELTGRTPIRKSTAARRKARSVEANKI